LHETQADAVEAKVKELSWLTGVLSICAGDVAQTSMAKRS
jgi:hypothetical protein